MKQRHVDLLILDSAQTVTVAPVSTQMDLGVIDEGGVAIKNGKIVEVGSSQLLEWKYSASRTIRVPEEIILPGLIDCHTHTVFMGSREQEFQRRLAGITYLENLRKGGGILETVEKTRQATEAELLAVSTQRLVAMLENGTTTLEVKSGYGLREYDEFKILKVISQLSRLLPLRIVSTFLGAHAVPLEHSQEEYTNLIIAKMLPTVANSHLAKYCDVFCEEGAFTFENSKRILLAAKEHGLKLKIHADQFSNNGGAKLANQLHATSADHLVHSDHAELAQMKKSGVIPVVLPASSDSLLSNDSAPLAEMLSDNLPVAIATDFSPSNWTLSLLTVASIAARRLRMHVEDIVRGITINAARALNLENTVGSLARGKRADLITLKASHYKMISYSHGENLVDKVLIEGRIVVENGRRTRAAGDNFKFSRC